MSFKYGQFGTGFLRAIPSPTALRFSNLVKTRGKTLTIVELTKTGEDDYGQPIYSESSHEEKAFLEMEGRERDLPPGTIKENLIRLFMARWAAISEDGHELEVDGVRYHVSSLGVTEACIEVEAVRKI